ncbi:MAG: hypothetical protein JNK72_17860 [Myxococcales bacterium]|nr:hypothetical protein [Myxococcales bacterium]
MIVSKLLERLIAGDTAVLHDAVVLVRGDGARFEGRDAVLAMFEASEAGMRYVVIGRAATRVDVALRVEGVPGEVRFGLEGRCEGELLCEVRVLTHHLV